MIFNQLRRIAIRALAVFQNARTQAPQRAPAAKVIRFAAGIKQRPQAHAVARWRVNLVSGKPECRWTVSYRLSSSPARVDRTDEPSTLAEAA